jgi:hypothetical protein
LETNITYLSTWWETLKPPIGTYEWFARANKMIIRKHYPKNGHSGNNPCANALKFAFFIQ